MVPGKLQKSACTEYENIRRNCIAYGSKENSKATLPLKNEFNLVFQHQILAQGLICIANHLDILA